MTDDQIIASALAILERKSSVGFLMSGQHDLISHAALRLHGERREVLLAYWLNADKRLLSVEEIAIGSTDTARFSIGHVIRRAVINGAEYCAFVHNHPNNDPSASDVDKQSATRIMQMLSYVGVLVLGQYVIGGVVVEEITTGERGQVLLKDDTSDEPRCPKCNASLHAPDSERGKTIARD